MIGFAKAILISILAAVAIIFFMNLSFFFPWYMTIVETTFELSQIVANENYINYSNFTDIDEKLRERPIFKERSGTSQLFIEAIHENGKDAIERNYLHDYDYYYGLASENEKPYVQMGNIVNITVTANYPLQIEIAGSPVGVADIPISFTMKTITLKHYKDLDYQYQ